MCTDCKALLGQFFIFVIGLYKINRIEMTMDWQTMVVVPI